MYDFQIIDIEKLKANISTYKGEWNSKKPFRYFSVDEFLIADWAEKILSDYPKPDVNWESTTYINQKNKFKLKLVICTIIAISSGMLFDYYSLIKKSILVQYPLLI